MIYSIESSINSIFAPLLNPSLRHNISCRLDVGTSTDSGPADLYVNLYSLLIDAMKYREFWMRLKWNYASLKSFRQIMNNYACKVVGAASDIEMTKLTKFVSDLNLKLAILTLLVNTDKMNKYRFCLVTHASFQAVLKQLSESILKSETRSKKLGVRRIPGLKRPIISGVVNVFSDEEIKEVIDFLREPEQAQLVTNLLSSIFVGDMVSVISSINFKQRLLRTFYDESNDIAGYVIFSLYMSVFTGFVKEI